MKYSSSTYKRDKKIKQEKGFDGKFKLEKAH